MFDIDLKNQYKISVLSTSTQYQSSIKLRSNKTKCIKGNEKKNEVKIILPRIYAKGIKNIIFFTIRNRHTRIEIKQTTTYLPSMDISQLLLL